MSASKYGYKKGFSQYSKAWYSKGQPLANNQIDKLNISLINEDDVEVSSFIIEWGELSGNVVPRLKVFDDAWRALSLMPELIQYMASIDDCNKPIDDFVKDLIDLGFIDKTPKTSAQ